MYKLVKLSLVPQCSKKTIIIDEAKGITIELRSQPPIEIFILLPTGYPSVSPPLFLVANTTASNSLFMNLYEHFSMRD